MSDFNEIWSLSTDFHESLQCQISRKSAQWELRWCVRTDRGMDRHDEGNKRLFFCDLREGARNCFIAVSCVGTSL